MTYTDRQKAALRLGLCDPRKMLTAEERAELNRDLTNLARQRREAEASSRNVVLS